MKKILFSVCLLLPAFAQAAQEWSLEDCINYAIEHSITVQQSNIAVQQREVELNTSKNSRLPGVSASSGENLSFGRGLTMDNTYDNTNTTSTSFSVGASVPVFQGFQITHNIEQSKLNLSAALEDLEKARDNVRVSVAQAYVQILYNMEILEVAAAQIEVDSLQVERLEAMMGNGKASQAEVSAQKATLAQSRLSLVQAQNNLNLSILDLTQLLELPSPEGFTVERPDASAFETGILMNPDEIFAEAVAVKPAIKSEEIRLEGALKSIDNAKSGYMPSLSLSGGLGTNYYTTSRAASPSFNKQIKDNFSQYVSLSLNIPVFSRMQNRNSVRSAKLSYQNQQLQLESTRKALYKEIQQAYYNAVASQSKLESSILAEQSAQEAFETTAAKYENGKAGITDYNQSKSRWMEAASNLAQARYQHLFQTRLLDFYRGEQLTF